MLRLKLVNASDKPQALTLKIDGAATGTAEMESLHAASYQATNTIDNPEFVHPVRSTMRVNGPEMQHMVAPMTIEVIDIPLR
jgi:alpha-L-arabinofuranosidase